MSEMVGIPYGPKPTEQAILLLAAAEEMGLPADVINIGGNGFVAPAQVAERAFDNAEPDSEAGE